MFLDPLTSGMFFGPPPDLGSVFGPTDFGMFFGPSYFRMLFGLTDLRMVFICFIVLFVELFDFCLNFLLR